MENQVIVSDYTQMDRVLREERQYILNIVKQIKKVGCNVLLIQKSILRYVVLCRQFIMKGFVFELLLALAEYWIGVNITCFGSWRIIAAC